MARRATNSTLHKAKGSKSDEFYTQYCDIERELEFYSGQFRGKTVYCNCDNPLNSNFVKFFIDNFNKLGLRKLIASYHVKPNCDIFFPDSDATGGYIEYSGDVTLENPTIRRFKGNGDFRSEECIGLLEKSDIVVTNPPFSLFREFISLLVGHGKKFLVIGNINAITYKEIFSLIRQNRVWLGHNMGRGISGFIVPESYELYGSEARIDENGNRIVATNNCLWLTNLDTLWRQEMLPLEKRYYGNESRYPTFDNYNGINVDRTCNIPMDYPGAMGVPITFLHKYNPRQFEIIRFRKGDDDKDLSINGRYPYFRILIRNLCVTTNGRALGSEHPAPWRAPATQSAASLSSRTSLFDS